ncbi:MAG: V-type ATP synthase subunit D [Candidatus Omnitrophota bacterium]|jgi:V/A-type H+-transporting ATPase subunit D
MKINIAATKTNLLNVKKSLEITREGYELLDQKRKILMSELSAIMHMADQLQAEFETALQKGYSLLDKAVVAAGRRKLEEISFSMDIKNDISLSQRKIMGVDIPVVSLVTLDHPPYYSPYDVSLSVEEVRLKFKEIVHLLAQVAEKRVALWRIARELQKTVRKVNALEKVYLPYYRNAFKYISERLDEESREAFSMLKLIKERMQQQEVVHE